ncbi:hypothetical protein GF420_15760 [candidate division GN15 bacterium]|nr:hypothetical protein [candidate division GN15 bacterium]
MTKTTFDNLSRSFPCLHTTPTLYRWEGDNYALDLYDSGWRPVNLTQPSIDAEPAAYIQFVDSLDPYFDVEDWVDEEDWEEMKSQVSEMEPDDFIEKWEDDFITLEERVEEFLMGSIDLQDSLTPMMNYYYEIGSRWEPVDAEEAQRTLWLESLPLTVVRVDGNYVLALTGGGMDFSWEICEAFMVLGFLPPVHFCRLPRIAGRGESDRDKEIVEACYQSVETVRTQHGWTAEHLNEHFRKE